MYQKRQQSQYYIIWQSTVTSPTLRGHNKIPAKEHDGNYIRENYLYERKITKLMEKKPKQSKGKKSDKVNIVK